MFRLLLAALVASHVAAQTTPLTSVIEQLQSLLKTSRETQKDEEVAHAKANQDQIDEIRKQSQIISAEEANMEEAQNSVDAETAKEEKAAADLKKAQDELAALASQKTNSEALADNRIGDLGTQIRDLDDTVTACDKAIDAVKNGMPGATMLIEEAMILADARGDRKQVQNFLQKADPDTSRKGSLRTYDAKSGGVVELLKGLRNDFQDQLNTAKLEHSNQNAAKEVAADANQKLTDVAKTDETDSDGRKTKAGTALDKAETALETATKARDDAQKAKSDAEGLKQTLQEEHDDLMQMRKDEQYAVEQAVKILAQESGIEMTTPKKSFIQLASVLAEGDPVQGVALALRRTGLKFHNSEMGRIADLVTSFAAAHAREDPTIKHSGPDRTKQESLEKGQVYKGYKNKRKGGVFYEIINAIEDMRVQMKREQGKDDKQKRRCDTDFENMSIKMTKTTKKLKATNTNLGNTQSDIDTTTDNVKDLKDSIAEGKSDLQTAETDRDADATENESRINDSENAQVAVERALEVLRKHYGVSEGEDISEAKTAAAGAKEVLTLLQDTHADYSKMEAEYKAAEETNKNKYNKLREDLEVQLSKDQTDHSGETAKNAELKEQRSQLETQKGQFEDKQTLQLNLSKDYAYSCDGEEAAKSIKDWSEDNLESRSTDYNKRYNERKDARKAEDEALSSAIKILTEAFAEK